MRRARRCCTPRTIRRIAIRPKRIKGLTATYPPWLPPPRSGKNGRTAALFPNRSPTSHLPPPRRSGTVHATPENQRRAPTALSPNIGSRTQAVHVRYSTASRDSRTRPFRRTAASNFAENRPTSGKPAIMPTNRGKVASGGAAAEPIRVRHPEGISAIEFS